MGLGGRSGCNKAPGAGQEQINRPAASLTVTKKFPLAIWLAGTFCVGYVVIRVRKQTTSLRKCGATDRFLAFGLGEQLLQELRYVGIDGRRPVKGQQFLQQRRGAIALPFSEEVASQFQRDEGVVVVGLVSQP